MSLYDYHVSCKLVRDDVPFYALIMAAMRRADTENEAILRSAYPDVWDEVYARYHATGGCLEGDHD